MNHLNYYIKGQGTTALVFLHGYLENNSIWEEFSNRLSENFTVICPDLPGHGKSAVISDISIENMAYEVKKLLDKLNIHKVIVLGHSMGGYVAIAFARLFTETTQKLVLIHSHPFADSDEKKANRIKELQMIDSGKKDIIITFSIPNLFSDYTKLNQPELIENIIQQALQTPDKGISAAINAMLHRPDLQVFIKNISIPMLWILGVNDAGINYKIMVDEFKENENIHFHLLENAAHMGFVEESESTFNAIELFSKT